jgi:hypothetical protein
VPRNLKKKKPFLFLDLLGTVAKVLSMYCFSDKYGYRVGSYKRKRFSFFRFVGGGG